MVSSVHITCIIIHQKKLVGTFNICRQAPLLQCPSWVLSFQFNISLFGLFIFEARSHYLAQADLELLIFLRQPPE